MKYPIRKITVFALLCLFGTALYAGISKHAADMRMQEAHDPKRKKAGEECKSSDECQRHHSCVKSGEKSICTAPPSVNIPNT